MLDPKLLYNDFEWVAKKLARRNFFLDFDALHTPYNLRKILQRKIEKLHIEKKHASKIINLAKSKGEDIAVLCKQINVLNKQLESMKLEITVLQNNITQYLLSLPNIPDDHIPDGKQDKNNLEIMRWGNYERLNFIPQDHLTLGKLIKQIDLCSAVKISGTRFPLMKGGIACLHRALSQFMMDLHTKTHGYEEYYVPYLVNQESLYGSGQLPKFHKDLFHVQPVSDQIKKDIYTLIPTAEVPLVNLMKNVIIKESDLPIKMVAHTPCFRAEAGAYGHRTHGLIRVHQFDKVELVQIVHPDQSSQVLEEMTQHAEKVLQLLELPYRKVLLCSGNMSFSACKTYDLEVWLPSHSAYCEISSCSNIRDFQARRLKARFKNKTCKKTKFLHTLNASGVAIGRALVAILENYQLKDGRIKIPTVLCPYMKDSTYI